MYVLGLQGSPRRKANTDFLLDQYLQKAAAVGAKTEKVDVCRLHIEPCIGCGNCERKGFCIHKDDMSGQLYAKLRLADVVVLASPVYFYNVPAQMKSLVDRSQTLWSRRYRLELNDPGSETRRGVMLSVGATRGKNLFEGMHLTAKYFFDAVSADYNSSLTYWQVEHPGDMAAHATVLKEVSEEVDKVIQPLRQRKRVLFLCVQNACRSQMAAGFARKMAGDRLEAICGGSAPAASVDASMVEAMAEKGIDMAFRTPQDIDTALENGAPDIIVTMGCQDHCPHVAGVQRLDWELKDPAGGDMALMRQVRDEIQQRVEQLIDSL